jgi:hypothetical protein
MVVNVLKQHWHIAMSSDSTDLIVVLSSLDLAHRACSNSILISVITSKWSCPVISEPDVHSIHHGRTLSKPAGQHCAAAAHAWHAEQRLGAECTWIRWASPYSVLCSQIFYEWRQQFVLTLISTLPWRLWRSASTKTELRPANQYG